MDFPKIELVTLALPVRRVKDPIFFLGQLSFFYKNVLIKTHEIVPTTSKQHIFINLPITLQLCLLMFACCKIISGNFLNGFVKLVFLFILLTHEKLPMEVCRDFQFGPTPSIGLLTGAQRLINLEIPVLVRSLKSSNIELG